MGEDLIVIGFLAASASWLVCFLISGVHKTTQLGQDDHVNDKPQRMHHHDVSRLGGVGIIIGLVVCVVLAVPSGSSTSGLATHQLFWLLIAGAPVFLIGLAEDITGKMPPILRMLGAIMSVFAASNFLGIVLHLPFLGGGIWIMLLSLAFTFFCVAGVINAFNIIDGLNGLATGIGIIATTALGWVAYMLGDMILVYICWITGMAILGFMLLNFPLGKIFLGDGGAYLIGFLGAEISILMVVRHPEVSWFFPMAVFIYPVTEVLFSIYRRMGKNKKAQHADALHLHSLVHKRMNRWRAGSHRYAALRNSISSTFFWVWNAINGLLAVFFWKNLGALVGLCLANIVFYTGMYLHLIYFKTPRWMIITEKQDMIQPEFAFSEMESTKSSKSEEIMPASDIVPEPNDEPVNKRKVDFKADNTQVWLL